MGLNVIEVKAFWDGEAGVWVATSDTLPGLATEAETTEKLSEKLRVIVWELIELNQVEIDKTEPLSCKVIAELNIPIAVAS